MMKTTIRATLALLIAATTSSSAGFSEPTYSDYVVVHSSSMDELGRNLDLSPPDIDAAKQIAAAYHFWWPCKGRAYDAALGNGSDGMTIISLSNTRLAIASRAFAFSLASDSMGRLPSRFSCQFAGEITFREAPPGSNWRYCFGEGLTSETIAPACRDHAQD